MTENKNFTAVIYALMAAVFYALNTPFSKVLLEDVPATFMAAFLYLGAGFGVGIMYLFRFKNEDKTDRLTKQDLPYTIGMIVLDILAPIFLMIGINIGSASNASLLGNFEIVATTLIALVIFRENVSAKLWGAIIFIVISSVILSFDGLGSLQFSYGSVFVILAASCWGLENNCTRKISDKSTYQIVVLKGVFSGSGSFLIALTIGEKLPNITYILFAMLLGFVAYGLSIFLYIRAQRDLGAAKTSAFYSVAPFVGSFLAFVINGEKLTWVYFTALIFMLAGTILVVCDTMMKQHMHEHIHKISHTHDGTLHTHIIKHDHKHTHFSQEEVHNHKHRNFISSDEHKTAHLKGV